MLASALLLSLLDSMEVHRVAAHSFVCAYNATAVVWPAVKAR